MYNIGTCTCIYTKFHFWTPKPIQVEWSRPAPDGSMCREFKEAETHVPSACGDRELP
jgi:hypothetical protein